MYSSSTIQKIGFQGNDRRCRAREPLNSVVLVLFGENDWGKLIEMSEGGMSFEFSQPPPLGQPLKFKFEPMDSMPGKSSAEIFGDFQVAGEAVWMREFERTAGVHFLNLSEASRERIHRWLTCGTAARDLTSPGEALSDAQIPHSASLEPVPPSPETPSIAVGDPSHADSQSVEIHAEPLAEPKPESCSSEELNSPGTLVVHLEEYVSDPATTHLQSHEFPVASSSAPDYVTRYERAYLTEQTTTRGGAKQQEAAHGPVFSARTRRATVVGASGCLAVLVGIVGAKTVRLHSDHRPAAPANAASLPVQPVESTGVKSAADAQNAPRFLVEVRDAAGRKWLLWFVQNPSKNATEQDPDKSPQPSVLPNRSMQTGGRQRVSPSRVDPPPVPSAADRPMAKDSSVNPPPAAAPPVAATPPTASRTQPGAPGDKVPNPEPSAPPPRTEPSAPPPRTEPEVSDLQEARLVKAVSPVYPPFARQSDVSGDVTVDAVIDSNGDVTQAKAISGPGLLQAAAIAAVLQWKYEPARLHGKPVPTHLTVTLQFHIR